MSPKDAYEKYLARAREGALLKSTADVLGWDEETYMPQAALEWRAEQQAYLGGARHRLMTSAEMGDLLSAAEGGEWAPESVEATNLREWRRGHDLNTKLPTEFVEEFGRTVSHSRNTWARAKSTDDYALFQPHLARVLELNRQKADYLGYATCRYDALLDEFEPGLTTAELNVIFDDLRKGVTALLPKALEASADIDPDALLADAPISKQVAFFNEVMTSCGFDLQAGRLDETSHPFCTTLGPRDVRLTTRYKENDMLYGLYSVLHEMGHGLYEQGLPTAYFGQPAGEAVSLGIHESQSRLWENKVGRSLDFWKLWLPKAAANLPELGRFSPEEITRGVNRVALSYIRTEADEFTYDLHVALRFGIEQKLIEGSLDVADLPEYWNTEFEKSFGIKVPDNRRGCLQDIHWSIGCFGYFPTYTLGNLNSAQLYRAALEQNPSLHAALAAGDYVLLLNWLRKNVHELGQTYRSRELIEKVTGAPTQVQPHLDYLRSRIPD
jgi:carboxypeptidase Taq